MSAGPILAGCDYSTEEVEEKDHKFQVNLGYSMTCDSKNQKLEQAKHMHTKKEEDILEH